MNLTIELPGGRLNIRCCAIIENPAGEILTSIGKSGLASLPGGRVELGEDSHDAVRREIFEETGLYLTEIEQVRVIENFYGNTHEILFLYRGTPDSYDLNSGAVDFEEQKLAWVPKENLVLKPDILNDIIKGA
ncbi:MAG: NUDIX domain-containing protein [Lactobacillales bacterium]|jgi:8-oxo-dGTP pyrophosphatase MutT (NUDIX family)|nr:NUDIX domain-containing protein [Lactobacillales bacterium]